MNGIRKYLLTLFLGIAGGFVAFFIASGWGAEERKPSTPIQYEITGPSVKPVRYNEELTGDGRIDLREAAKRAVPGVVHVKTVQMGKEYVGNPLLYYFFGRSLESREVPRETGFGSGVIVSEDGYIITNNHVINGADKVTVVLNDKQEYEAKIVGQDANTDIALLKVEGKDFPYVKYGNSDDVSLGEWVLAVGNPYNLTSTVTAGIISAKARDLGMGRGQMSIESFLQTDAAVNPGNSGGALVNARGELIGINTLIQSPTGAFSGYAFAIPVNIARKVVNDLKSYGKVQRAVLGIRMGELTPVFAEELGVKETSGIYVADVIAGGAAEKAGIKKDDIIQGVNGITIKTAPEFQEQLGKYNPGAEIELVIKRKGVEKKVNVVLQNSFGNTSIDKAFSGDILGVKVEPLTREDRYRYRLDKGVKIKEIKDGKFKSVGLDKGYVIVKINNDLIYDEEDLKKAIDSVTDGGVFVTAMSPRGRVEYYAFSLLN